MKENSREKKLNAINVDWFILAAVYLLEPIDVDTLSMLLNQSGDFDNDLAYAMVLAGVTVLRKRGLIERIPNSWCFDGRMGEIDRSGLKLTSTGVREIKLGTRDAKPIERSALDRLRVNAIHWQYKRRGVTYK